MPGYPPTRRVAAALLAAPLAAFSCASSAAAGPQAVWKQTLQAHVERLLHKRDGAVVVLAVSAGELLAVYPPRKAAQRLAAPGSAIKPFTLMALIDAGKITPDSRLLCPVHLTLAGRTFDCTHPSSAEPFDAPHALAWSCNNWFAGMARLLAPQELHVAFEGVGLFSPTSLVKSEMAGSARDVPSGDLFQLQAIGAANIQVTPLALAAAYRRLALLRLDPAGAEKYAAIFRGLEDSVAYGMAREAQLGAPFQSAGQPAGKTGTSGSGRGYTHAWFAGYWPAAAPEIVVVVFLERGRGGPDAAPIAREIFTDYLRSR